MKGVLPIGVVACLLFVAVCACEDKPDLSEEGESCTKKDDCKPGLKCMGLVCVPDGSSGDISGPREVISTPVEDLVSDSDQVVWWPHGPIGCATAADCQPGEDCVVVQVTEPTTSCILSAPGHWTDPASGLTWQVWPPTVTFDPELFEGAGGTFQIALHVGEAHGYCDQLNLDGHSDWCHPTIEELRTLVRGCPATEAGGECDLAILCPGDGSCPAPCDGCPYEEGPAEGCYWPEEMKGECFNYNSSSPGREADEYWGLDFTEAGLLKIDVDHDAFVRCVR